MMFRRAGMTVLFGVTVILGGAACGNGAAGTGGAAGAGGSGGSTSTTTTTTTSTTTMNCELQFTEASGANLELTSFSSGPGQGNTTHEDGHPVEYGIAASANTSTSSVILNITVSGDAPAKGESYTVATDAFSLIDLSINDVVGGTGLHDWVAAPGSVVTIAAVGPGPVPHYTNVTFQLDGVLMQPSTIATMNNAMGTFKASGQCAGNIQDLQ